MEKRVAKKCNLKKKQKKKTTITTNLFVPNNNLHNTKKINRYNMERVQASQKNHRGLKKIGQHYLGYK